MAREFVCSERFRVNAQKKVIDVWLNYRCAECGNVWKLPVIERRPVAALEAELHDAFARHDPATVWKYAFDLGRMRSHVLRVNADVEFTVLRTPIDTANASEPASGLAIDIDAPFVCDIRLDRLLASELRVSRAAVQRWYECGELIVRADEAGALSRRVRSGQRVVLPKFCEGD